MQAMALTASDHNQDWSMNLERHSVNHRYKTLNKVNGERNGEDEIQRSK